MTLKLAKRKKRDTERVEHGTIKYGHETWIHRLSTLRINVACPEGTGYVSQEATHRLLQPPPSKKATIISRRKVHFKILELRNVSFYALLSN